MNPIRAERLSKVFEGHRGRKVKAVQDVSFEVKEAEIFGLLGPNGAGKTTLLRMLGTIIRPTSGECWVAGTRASENPDQVRRQIGFLSGNTKLYGRLKVTEVLRYFGRLYSMADKAIEKRTGELASMLEMHDFLDQRCESLSTGQMQKASIARVLLHDPSVLILDEPTMGLDIMSSRTIIQFIRDTAKKGHAVIFSTHTMHEAEALCDRIGLIHEGRILSLGTPEELYGTTGTANLQDAFLAIVQGEGSSTE